MAKWGFDEHRINSERTDSDYKARALKATEEADKVFVTWAEEELKKADIPKESRAFIKKELSKRKGVIKAREKRRKRIEDEGR